MKYSLKKWMLLLVVAMFAPGLIFGDIYLGVFPNPVVHAQSVSPKSHAQKIIDGLAAIYPSDVLPTYVLTENDPLYVTAATTGSRNQDDFNILYYAEDKPIEINDLAVNNLTPIAAFQKSTYDTEQHAADAVQQVLDLQGQKVDLGYGITGYMQGAAGSSYLNWQEGNWSLVVQASNIDNEDPVPLAKEIVTYLEEIYLPAPTSVGQITLRVTPTGNYKDNTVIWQDGNIVYKVSHYDAMHAVIMAGSITNPTEQ
ncbi:hypothetical protein [Fundicoccus culcitae]|uniref:Regulatory protein YycH-like domain-containing protein n=1 Tax=Fundicoccus culcitae TaxID=2969821 RepID=A0ABY5P867_9LACT|nr:hypothetical protein [Fundicoccus culcitae]UUX34946.1 hypothetical protein NRE15_04680 [Fundicoccus culcitae]